jgi:hypothetical protein
MRLGIAAGWQPPPAAARVAAAAPPPPAYGRIVAAPRVSGDNATAGDCVETGCYNAVQTALARAGDLAPLPNCAVLRLYSQLTGYVSGNPATDNGTDPAAMFAWWQTNQIAGYRLVQAIPLPASDQATLRATIARAGGIACVLNLSTANQNQRVLTPDGVPGSWGKHFVWLDGYDGRIISGTSWGEAFYLDESYFDQNFVISVTELALVAE